MSLLRPLHRPGARAVFGGAPAPAAGGGGGDALQTFIDEMSVDTIRKHNVDLITDHSPPLTKAVFDYDFIVNGAGANNAWADDAAVAVEMGAAAKYFLTDANGVCWVPWLKRSYAIGGGGHNNYGGNEGYYYDWLTGEWTRANDPNPYIKNGAHPTLAADPSQLTTPSGTPDWYPWPRSDGVRGPYSLHTYDLTIALEDQNALFSFGASTFGPNPGPPGGAVYWDLDTDDWQQTGAIATTLSFLNGRARLLPGGEEIWMQAGSQNAFVVNIAGGTVAERNIKFSSGNPGAGSPAMIGTDRITGGSALEAFSLNSTLTDLAIWPRINDDSIAWNNVGHRSYLASISGSAPSGLQVYQGWDYVDTNDTIYHWTGGATLNRMIAGTPAWTTSLTLTQHASAADIPATALFSAANPCLGKFRYIPEYSTAGYAIFFLFEDTDAADGNAFVAKVGL